MFNSNSIKNDGLKKRIWFNFLKIFSLFFFAMLPVALHSIIPLFITNFNGNIEITGSIVAQSINYNQPMLFLILI